MSFSSGGVSSAALLATEPNVSVRPDLRWTMDPATTSHSLTGTSHVFAAEATSMMRAAAPARRSRSKLSGVERLPPANCGPNAFSSTGAISIVTAEMSTPNSSARIMGSEVFTPWPHSGFLATSVTLPSGVMRMKAFGVKDRGVSEAPSASSAQPKPSSRPPPKSAETRRKLRRSMGGSSEVFGVFMRAPPSGGSRWCRRGRRS